MEKSAPMSDSTAEFRCLVSRLKNWDTQVQASAVRDAISLGPKGMEAISLAIRQMAKQANRTVDVSCMSLLLGGAGLLLVFILPSALFVWAFCAAMVGMIGLGITVIQSNRNRPMIILQRLMALVFQIKDKRKIGLLVDSFHVLHLDLDTRKTVRTMLTQMLLTLRSSDTDVLSLSHRQLLSKTFRFQPETDILDPYRMDSELFLAILKAFEQIGGSSETDVVERLAHLIGEDSQSKVIRQAAQTCLPLLRQNAILEKDRMALLRGSSAPVDGARILLRPAEGVTYVPPEELLRPDSDPKHEA